MVIDSHAHYEPRMLDEGALLAKLDAAGIDRVALIPAMNDPLPETPERLLALARRLARNRVGRVLFERIHRSTLTPEGDLKLARRIFQIYARPDNEPVLALARRHPDRVLGWIFLNPRNNPQVLDDLERWRGAPGAIGVKLHPHWHDWRVEQAWPVFARAAELRLPVLIHLGFGARGDYQAIAAAFPSLTLICAHAGLPYHGQLWRDARGLPNVHVDLSSPYLDERTVRDTVAAMGPGRCLFGTDSPYGFHGDDGSYDYGRIRGWIDRLPVSDADRERILGGNFLALLGR